MNGGRIMKTYFTILAIFLSVNIYSQVMNVHKSDGNTDSFFLSDIDSITFNFPIISTEGLVAYYPFNGNANDESGNGNHGSVYGATSTSDRFGNANKAYNFNGINNYISFQNEFYFHKGTDITFSIWLLNSGSSIRTSILISTLSYSDINRFHIYYTQESSQNFFTVDYRCPVNCGSGSANQLVHYSPWSKNEWTHFIVMRKNNEYFLYVNGKYIGQKIDNSPDLPNSVGWTLGKPIGVMDYYNGRMDDIRIYNRSLTSEEIETLYHENGWK
jgi:hypothetical protein